MFSVLRWGAHRLRISKTMILAEKVDVVLPASSLRGGYNEVVREIEACVEDLGRSARPRMPPPAVFDVAECQKIVLRNR